MAYYLHFTRLRRRFASELFLLTSKHFVKLHGTHWEKSVKNIEIIYGNYENYAWKFSKYVIIWNNLGKHQRVISIMLLKILFQTCNGEPNRIINCNTQIQKYKINDHTRSTHSILDRFRRVNTKNHSAVKPTCIWGKIFETAV